MGILPDRLISMEPWLQDSVDGETIDHLPLQTGGPSDAATTTFLDWRWAMPTARTVAPMPSSMTEQPLFDALHGLASSKMEDGRSLIEFDGFLIDRHTAVAAGACLGAPIAA